LLNSTDDEVLVIDPESEYGNLCNNFNGEVIKISNDTNTYFNPLDITMDYSGGDDDEEDKESSSNPLSFKTEFMFSFLDVIVTKESGMGLSGAERTLVDRTLTETYKNYFRNPKQGMPTLIDFCKELKKVKAPELQAEKENLLKVLGLYTTGSFNLFAHHTNVDVNNKFVVYDIKELGDQIKTLGMLVILDQVWNKVTSNRLIGRKTWIIVDEAHLLFSNPFSAQFLSSLWKRARKYGGICTGITQNVEDLLESDLARKMLSNSDYIMMLNQATSDRVKLGEILNISDTQLGFVTNANAGQGLLFAGNSIIPFIDEFPSDTKLYAMMTTKLDEVVKREEAEKENAE
jgi:type IV secretory pathway VirB4 component